MDQDFPLSLPTGTSIVRLSSDEVCQADDDCAWLVQASTGGKASATWELGKPPFGRHLCLHRLKLWWMSPSHGSSGLDVPPETSLLLAERILTPDKLSYVVLLPVSDSHARANLHRLGPSAPGPSTLALSADTGDDGTPLPETLGILLVATGPDPFRIVRNLVQAAIARLTKQIGPDKRVATRSTWGKLSAPVAAFADTFGWCTWDSFYTMVNPEGIVKGLTTLHEEGVLPRWVIIDDGWQRTTNDDALNTEQWDERLVGLEANKRFRCFDDQGHIVLDLKDTVTKMKTGFGVEKVLAWHAMVGYWAGVDPDAKEMSEFRPSWRRLVAPEGIRKVDPEMQPELNEKAFGMVAPDHIEGFYTAYHRYLRDNGVDGVKVDVQSILDCMGGANEGVPAITRAYHEGLCRSVEATFKEEARRPPAIIHCMCHASSVLFHIAALSQDLPVVRGSDDFYPAVDASHGPHLYTNAFNAILLSNIGLQDWDMFQTKFDAAQGGIDADENAPAGTVSNASWFHAAARAISGGPVYVSDKPGQHNKDILARLVLDDGSILRAVTNALPTLDCLLRDPQVEGGGLLQVWALNPLAGTAVVGSFNVRGASFSTNERTWKFTEELGAVPVVSATVSPSDVHAFTCGDTSKDEGNEISAGTDAGTYALYLHCAREARLVRFNEATGIKVAPLRYELATFSKVIEVGLRQEHGARIRWAAIGLVHMFNSSASVMKQELKTSLSVTLSVRGSGTFLALASEPPIQASLKREHDCVDGREGNEQDDLEVFTSSLAEAPSWDERCVLVQVELPGPWDGQQRRLIFSWA